MSPSGSLVSVSVVRHDLAFRKPLITAQGTLTERPVFLLSVRDADGFVGVGEAAPLAWAGTESTQQCAAALALLEPALLRGADTHTLPPDCPAAAAALDLALRDLAACRLAVPLAQLFGEDRVAADVAVNALVADVDEAVAAVEAGFSTLKLKVAGIADAARVAAVRDVVGPSIALRIDANGAWTDAASAIAALDSFAGLDLEYVEQPVAAHAQDSVDALAAVRAAISIPVAPDESVTDLPAARELLDAGAADVLVLKPMRLGGLDVALQIARLARERDVHVVVTGFLGSIVERTAALHLAAALDGSIPEARRRAHGLGAGSWLADDLAPVEVITNGRLPLPGRAGHGVVLHP